jgi:hypothetical protein
VQYSFHRRATDLERLGLFGGRRIRFLADELGWNVPRWICALIAAAIVAVLGYRQIDVSVKVLSVLVAAEFLVVLILGAVIVVKGGSFGTSGLSLEPLTPQRWFRGRYRSPCCSASPRSSDSNLIWRRGRRKRA